VNDVFRVVTSLDGIVSFDMRIFNRWGEMVFESTDIHSGWNGMVNGRLAPEGSYAWTLVYKGSSQSSTFPPAISLHGTVVLIR
jgi:gliding motility-associated-like protein